MSISVSVLGVSKSYQRTVLSSFLPSVLSKRVQFPMSRALNDVTFSVTEGERIGVIGENGAGKSTLLRIIAGVEWQTSGHLDVVGHVHAALTLGVGLREELSGRENLILDAQIQDLDLSGQGEEMINKMIEFAELGEFIDQPVRTYSSGMKSRLCFTSLVFVEPEILLIDEALSTGDGKFQKKASAAVRALCDKGRIVFIVSHSIDTIRTMCSRCIWLSEGRIRADGPVETVTDLYTNYQRMRTEERNLKSKLPREMRSFDNSAGAMEISVRDPTYSGEENSNLSVRRPASFSVMLITKRELLRPVIRSKIIRIDGLCVVEQNSADVLPMQMPPGNYDVTADIPEIWLAPGFYSIEIELRSMEEVVLRQTLSFRVHADELMRGGAPVLYQPIDLRLER